MSIVLQGSTSGSITLQEPAIAGSTVLSLPATSGTLITTGSSAAITQSMLATSVIPIGADQTWQYVTRAKRTTYQNTTGRPIAVAISFYCPFTSTLELWTHSSSANILTNGVKIMYADGGDYYSSSAYTNHPANISAIIPNNYYYQAYDPNNDGELQIWTELR